VNHRKTKAAGRFGLIAFGLLALLLFALPLPVFAQSCALCYTQAASSGSKMIQALRSGILILIIPPTLGSIGLIFVVHRRRNQVRQTESSGEPGQDW
jgi:uncharacterized BrkB/YihY/UPF0761 family membrane protein